MTLSDRILAVSMQVEAASKAIQKAKLSDKEALEIAYVYPEWKTDTDYETDDIVRRLGGLYRVVQSHASQEGWEPENAPSLFSPVKFTPSGHEEWTKPTGAHDAYDTGDVVEHNGKVWESLVDGNVWEPGVYGWKEIIE